MRIAVIALNLFVWVGLSCASQIYLMDKQERIIKQCDLPVLYTIAVSTPIEQVEIIRSGFNHWNEALNTTVFLETNNIGEWDLGNPETKAFVIAGVASSDAHLPKGACGATSFIQTKDGCTLGAVVTINPNCLYSEEITETIVRHEGGHVLGLGHSSIFTDLMFVAIEPTVQHPVDANESEVRAIQMLYLGK